MDYKELMVRVNNAVSMVDLLGEFGTTLRTPTHEEQISCPFHGKDSKPSARHYPDTNSVYCFTCKKSWDPIRFMMDKRAMRFKEVLDLFGRKYGIEVSGIAYDDDGSRYVKFRKENAVERKSGLTTEEKLMFAKGALEAKILSTKGKVPPAKYMDFVYLMSHMWCMDKEIEFLPIARKVSDAIDRIIGAQTT